MNQRNLQEQRRSELERVFSGSLSLFGILMAIFTFIFLEYKPEMQTSYGRSLLPIVFLAGGLVSVCGISSIVSHYALLKGRPSIPSYLLFLLLGVSTITPFILWIFAL